MFLMLDITTSQLSSLPSFSVYQPNIFCNLHTICGAQKERKKNTATMMILHLWGIWKQQIYTQTHFNSCDFCMFCVYVCINLNGKYYDMANLADQIKQTSKRAKINGIWKCTNSITPSSKQYHLLNQQPNIPKKIHSIDFRIKIVSIFMNENGYIHLPYTPIWI